jgi:hypothetical protein
MLSRAQGGLLRQLSLWRSSAKRCFSNSIDLYPQLIVKDTAQTVQESEQVCLASYLQQHYAEGYRTILCEGLAEGRLPSTMEMIKYLEKRDPSRALALMAEAHILEKLYNIHPRCITFSKLSQDTKIAIVIDPAQRYFVPAHLFDSVAREELLLKHLSNPNMIKTGDLKLALNCTVVKPEASPPYYFLPRGIIGRLTPYILNRNPQWNNQQKN